jgi:hypothetical protein
MRNGITSAILIYQRMIKILVDRIEPDSQKIINVILNMSITLWQLIL